MTKGEKAIVAYLKRQNGLTHPAMAAQHLGYSIAYVLRKFKTLRRR